MTDTSVFAYLVPDMRDRLLEPWKAQKNSQEDVGF